MNNKYGHIYESANLDQLERQILSGYLTEETLSKSILENKFDKSQLAIIEKLKPELGKVIEEANPVGVGSRIKNWGMSKIPSQSVQATAQGRAQFAQQANALKYQYNRYVGSIGKNASTVLKSDLATFLQQKGVDLNRPEFNDLIQNPNAPISDIEVNDIIRTVTSTKMTTPPTPQTVPAQTAAATPPQQQQRPPAVPAQASPSQSNLTPQQVNAIASALNQATGQKTWDWAKTQGFIKRLRAAGLNIS